MFYIIHKKMANYSTSQFKNGLKLMLGGNPCSIISNEIRKPGKGQASNRVKLKDLITGKTLEKTFKSGESVEGADVMELDLQYLYNDGSEWNFMDPDSFEQYAIDDTSMDDTRGYLVEQDMCVVTLWNKLRNKALSKRRFVVERTTGTLKRTYGLTKSRYIGLEKVASEVNLKAITYNLIRVANVYKGLIMT